MTKHLPAIMRHYGQYLERGETIGDCIDTDLDYTIVPVNNPTLGKNGRVLLDIYTETERSVLIGGNPLKVEVLDGRGILSLIDLETGKRENKSLEPGMETTISPSNTVYWYENLGPVNLILKDTCPGFDPSNEPTLEEVSAVIGNLLTWGPNVQ